MTDQKDTMPDEIWACENPDRARTGEKILPHYHAYPEAIYSLGRDQRFHHDRIVQAKDAEIAKLKQERDLLAREYVVMADKYGSGWHSDGLVLANKIVKESSGNSGQLTDTCEYVDKLDCDDGEE